MNIGQFNLPSSLRHASRCAAFGFVIGIVIVLTACAEIPSRQIPPGPEATLANDEVLIFGKIRFIQNGKPITSYTLAKPLWELWPISKKKNGRAFSTEEDGSFYYVIPVGTYNLNFIYRIGYRPSIDPSVRFNVASGGQAVYLGTLSIDIELTSWLGGFGGNSIYEINIVEVVDEFEAAKQQLLVRYPDMGGHRISESLMFHVPGTSPHLLVR